MFARLASKSLLNRKGSVLLTIMAMTVSIFVLLGVEFVIHLGLRFMPMNAL